MTRSHIYLASLQDYGTVFLMTGPTKAHRRFERVGRLAVQYLLGGVSALVAFAFTLSGAGWSLSGVAAAAVVAIAAFAFAWIAAGVDLPEVAEERRRREH